MHLFPIITLIKRFNVCSLKQSAHFVGPWIALNGGHLFALPCQLNGEQTRREAEVLEGVFCISKCLWVSGLELLTRYGPSSGLWIELWCPWAVSFDRPRLAICPLQRHNYEILRRATFRKLVTQIWPQLGTTINWHDHRNSSSVQRCDWNVCINWWIFLIFSCKFKGNTLRMVKNNLFPSLAD